jgi:hypothetical protein
MSKKKDFDMQLLDYQDTNNVKMYKLPNNDTL